MQPAKRRPACMPLESKSLTECHAQLSQQLAAYYERTKLLAVVRGFVRELSQRFASTRFVPLNPFVPLLAHVRLAEISADELLLSPRPRDLMTFPPQEVLIFDPRDGRTVPVERQIATFKTQPPPALAVWGWRGVLERIPYSDTWQRAVDSVYDLLGVWLRENEGTDEGYGVFSVSAVAGPQVFFFGHQRELEPLVVDIERHVVVRGGQLEQAMTVFARQQIRFLFEATKKNALLVIETGHELSLIGSSMIEISTPAGNGKPSLSTWTLDRITPDRQAFLTAVKLALVENGCFVVDLVYTHTSKQATDESSTRITHVRVSFIFHFDCGPPPPGVQPLAAAKSWANSGASRSFVKCSRVGFSGIFLSTRAAYEVTRRISDQQDRDAKEAMAQPPVVLPRGTSIVDDLLHSLGQLTRSSSETCHWMRILPSTTSFRLLSLASLTETMLHVLRSVPLADEKSVRSVFGSTLRLYQECVGELVQDASIGRSSSQLHGLSRILRELCCLPEPSTDPKYLDLLYQGLQRSQEAIAWLASAATRDICRLVERTVSTASTSSPASYPCADLRPDISAAIDDRRFPLTIVAENVFAQYIVETGLDLALERSIVNTVASGLPPDPFVSFGAHLRNFGTKIEYAAEIVRPHTQVQEETLTPVPGVGFAVDVSRVTTASVKVIVSANERLLQLINFSRVLVSHGFLVEREVYRTGSYHPSKATYSSRIVTSILVDDPKMAIAVEQLDGTLLQSADLVEHIFIEGKEFRPALQFFADAVRRDASHLLEKYAEAELRLLDPVGELVTTVELRDLQTFELLLVEATPKLCNLVVHLPPVVQGKEDELVRLATKTYIFHHQPTEDQPEELPTVSERLRFRIRKFGVFLDSEAARLALSVVGDIEKLVVPETVQTAYGARALRREDNLLLSHIRRMVTGPVTSQPNITLLRLLDMEVMLEWLLNRLVFQQQTTLTPRSESVALVTEARTLLNRVANCVEHYVIPRVEIVGVVDTRRIVETIKSIQSFCGDTNTRDAEQAMETAETLTLRLWTLILLIRFSVQADMT